MIRLSGLSIALLSALGLLFASPSRAQDNAEEEAALAFGDKESISLATGSRQTVRRAPAVATVITAEEIAAIGATDLDQVLATVPGIHLSVNADGYSSAIAVRGIYSPITNAQVLMLQNGVPMTISFAGDRGRFGSNLPIDNIARVEIIRGPGSALYGADAFAGVINVITKTAADTPGSEVGVRAGSFDSRDVWLQHGGSLGPVSVAAYLRYGTTDGQREIITADGATRLDRLFGTNASRAPGPVNVGHDDVDGSLDLAYGQWRWRSSYKLRENIGTGAGVSSALDPDGEHNSERITSDLSWTDPQFAEYWGLGATASYLHYREKDDFQLFPAGTQFPTGSFAEGMIGRPERYERQVRLSTFATYSGFEKHRWRVGLGHDDLDLYKTVTLKNYLLNANGVPVPTGPVIDYGAIQPHIAPQRRQFDYVYFQDEWSLARDWTLTGGLRHDDYSDFGGTTNPRLALVWDAALNLTAKLLYGRAFRAPSFTEQYGTNPTASGNPNIRPETLESYEAAFAWQARRDLLVNLNVFHYQMDDVILVTPNPAPAPGATFNNSGRQHGDGMELETVWNTSHALRMTAHYAYQRSIDETTQADAGYMPHHQVYLRADWSIANDWLLSSQFNAVADRARQAGDPRPKVSDYTTVDFTLRTNKSKHGWDFAASVHNLFDADVREPSQTPGALIPNDLPMAGRSIWAEVRYGI